MTLGLKDQASVMLIRIRHRNPPGNEHGSVSLWENRAQILMPYGRFGEVAL
jgi:hypothetical protein